MSRRRLLRLSGLLSVPQILHQCVGGSQSKFPTRLFFYITCSPLNVVALRCRKTEFETMKKGEQETLLIFQLTQLNLLSARLFWLR